MPWTGRTRCDILRGMSPIRSLLPLVLGTSLVRGLPARADEALDEKLPPRAVARLGTYAFWHRGTISALAYSPDGKLIASGGSYGPWKRLGHGWGASNDCTIRLWDAVTGRQVKALTTPAGVVHAVCFSPDGKRLAAGCGLTFAVWDLQTGKERHRFDAIGGQCTFVQFAPNGSWLAGGEERGVIQCWDTTTGKQRWQRSAWDGGPPRPKDGKPAENCASAALSPDGKRLAWLIRKTQGAEGEAIRLVDAITSKPIRQIDCGFDQRQVRFSPDGRFLVAGLAQVNLWDIETGTKQFFEGAGRENAAIESWALSKDGRLLAMRLHNLRVRVWDLRQKQRLSDFTLHRADDSNQGFARKPLAFSPDGKNLAAGVDSSVQLWDPTTGRQASAQPGHRGQVSELQFTPDSRTLYSTGAATHCRWDTSRWQQTDRHEGLHPSFTTDDGLLDVSIDGRLGLRRVDDGRVQIVNVRTGQALRHLDGRQAGPCTGLFSPDMSVALLRGEADGNASILTLYEVATGREISRLRWEESFHGPLFSLDGQRLAWISDEASVCVLDVPTGRLIQRLKNVVRKTPILCFSADGRRLAIVVHGRSAMSDADARDDNTVHLWDIAAGQEVRQFVLPLTREGSDRVACLALSPDHRLLATGQFGEPDVRLWETASGQERGRLLGHQDSVVSLAFSPDNKLLASGSADTTALIWNIQQAPGPAPVASTAELNAQWEALMGDASRAESALAKLVRAPHITVPFLKERLKTDPTEEARLLDRLIGQLDSNSFAVRQQATDKLEGLGQRAQPALQRTLQARPSLEVHRRVVYLLGRLNCRTPTPLPPDQLREVRAVEALERIGNADARQHLEALSGGDPDLRLTQEARGALARISKVSRAE